MCDLPSQSKGKQSCPSACKSMMNLLNMRTQRSVVQDVMFLPLLLAGRQHGIPWFTCVIPVCLRCQDLLLRSACLLSEVVGVRQGRHDHWAQKATEVRFQGQPAWQWCGSDKLSREQIWKRGLGGREKEKNLVIADEIFSVEGSNGLEWVALMGLGIAGSGEVSWGCECSLLPWWLSTRDAQHKLPALNFWLNIALLFIGAAMPGFGHTPFRALNCW